MRQMPALQPAKRLNPTQPTLKPACRAEARQDSRPYDKVGGTPLLIPHRPAVQQSATKKPAPTAVNRQTGVLPELYLRS